ncbi:MAG: hypothetical protein AAFY66_12455, partial [Pseudomonadota bacterium]
YGRHAPGGGGGPGAAVAFLMPLPRLADEDAHIDDAGRELSRGNFYGCLRKLRQLLPVEEKLLAEGGNPLPAPAPAQASGRPRMPLPADRPTSVPAAMHRVTGVAGATAAVTGIDRQGLRGAGWPRVGE